MFQYLSTFYLISLLAVYPVDCKLLFVVGLTALPARSYFPCACSVSQSHLTLYDAMDCSLLGSCLYGFFRQKYWSGLPFPPPGNLPDPRIKPASPVSPALQVNSILLRHWESPSRATAVNVLSHNHWTTREFPVNSLFFKSCKCLRYNLVTLMT